MDARTRREARPLACFFAREDEDCVRPPEQQPGRALEKRVSWTREPVSPAPVIQGHPRNVLSQGEQQQKVPGHCSPVVGRVDEDDVEPPRRDLASDPGQVASPSGEAGQVGLVCLVTPPQLGLDDTAGIPQGADERVGDPCDRPRGRAGYLGVRREDQESESTTLLDRSLGFCHGHPF